MATRRVSLGGGRESRESAFLPPPPGPLRERGSSPPPPHRPLPAAPRCRARGAGTSGLLAFSLDMAQVSVFKSHGNTFFLL